MTRRPWLAVSRRSRIPLAACFVVAASSHAAADRQTGRSPMVGFTPAAASQERALEQRFDAALRGEDLRAWMKRLTAHPHHLGTPYDHENAEFIASQFRSWGFDTQLEKFTVLFPTPRVRRLEMAGPHRFRARLDEPVLAADATSGADRRSPRTGGQLPPYNAYSIDGDVTAPLVYANFGVPEDYDELALRGVDVRGKIVIVRYGRAFRGVKPKLAAEHGAVGCIIYSDPHEDGFFAGDVYPEGPFRPESSVQRGSVADVMVEPGDPLTPGIGATDDAKRLAIKDAPTLTRIPCLPISYGDALPLLRELGGPVAPEPWRGALPVTYHLGAGPAAVHLVVKSDWNMVPLYDVIAKLTGAELPDEWVIRGNHEDAWVFGAEDPISGTVAEMEEARGVGELARSGWKPKRTMVYAVWDGEEEGLFGSTEWVEAHADLLSRVGAVYVNSDSNTRGLLEAGGSHSLEQCVDEIAHEVRDPERGVSAFARLRARRLAAGGPSAERDDREHPEMRIAALGSGSDYTPFLQHLGIASLNLEYGGEGVGGQYHSSYDSFDHYTRFGDPGFEYGIALAETAGRAMLRCADADLLPLDFTRFAATLDRYVGEVSKLADDTRAAIDTRNRLIADGTLIAAQDPTKPFVAPKARAACAGIRLRTASHRRCQPDGGCEAV